MPISVCCETGTFPCRGQKQPSLSFSHYLSLQLCIPVSGPPWGEWDSDRRPTEALKAGILRFWCQDPSRGTWTEGGHISDLIDSSRCRDRHSQRQAKAAPSNSAEQGPRFLGGSVLRTFVFNLTFK